MMKNKKDFILSAVLIIIIIVSIPFGVKLYHRYGIIVTVVAISFGLLIEPVGQLIEDWIKRRKK